MKSHKRLLYEYFFRTEDELTSIVTEYENRIRRRRHDQIDFLELMLAEERLSAFRDFRRDVLTLLKIELKENKNDNDEEV